MTSDTPGAGQPDPAEPPAPPAEPAPTSGDASPTEVVPPLPAAPGEPPPFAAAQAPVGQPPVGQPPLGPPPAGQPPAGPPTQPGQWGAPPPQQPSGWEAAAPGAAPQQPGWAPAPGEPGGAPGSGPWNPAPASSSGNGCLKACIVVAIVLVVIAAIGVAALFFFARQFASDLGVNPDTGEAAQCSLVTTAQLNSVFGGTEAHALPMRGLVDATIGRALDKRVLGSAEDCWIVASTGSTSVTGRIAAQDSSNASGDFDAAKAAAQQGKYFAGDVPGYGDQAFCTAASDVGSFGILVRSGGRLVYVSLLDPTSGALGDWVTSPDGVTTSPDTCALAGEIAKATLR